MPRTADRDAVGGHPAAGHEDGRTERTRRTRAAIVGAHLALLAEGELRPTAQRIAERTGISVRTLWTHFPDMDAIYAATAEAVLRQQKADYRPVPADLPLDARVDRFCRQRARQLERISSYAYASQLREPVSPMLQGFRTKHVQRVVRELEDLFAAELATVPQDRQELVHAMAVASTWGSWAVLRQHLGLGPVRARKVMTRTVSALLTGALSASRGGAAPQPMKEPL